MKMGFVAKGIHNGETCYLAMLACNFLRRKSSAVAHIFLEREEVEGVLEEISSALYEKLRVYVTIINSSNQYRGFREQQLPYPRVFSLVSVSS